MERIPKYKEIFKLKKMLEDANIPFDFQNGYGSMINPSTEVYTKYPDLLERYQICYPVFDDTKRKLSAVQGLGTYGAEQDLIEIMGLLTPEEASDDCVVGYLTAEDVFKRIKNDYNKKGVKVMKTKKVTLIDEQTLELKEVETPCIEDDTEELSSQIKTRLNCDPETFSEKYLAYKKAEAEFNEIYNPFKLKLLELYEKSKETLPNNIIIGGVKLIHVDASTRNIIDTKKLKEEEPELVKKYNKPTKVNATIRLEGI